MDPFQQLLIERECERLLIQSMWNTDFGVASHTADLFVPAGVMYVGTNTVRGQDAIRATFLKRQAMTGRTSRHVATNIVVTVRDEDHASATCYVTVYRRDQTQILAMFNGPASVGQQDVEFVRTSDGWRFTEIRAAHIFLFHD